MALIKLSNNGVKNVSSLSGLTSSVGDLVFISKQTASSSASISFTSGIDSTYKEYVFYFKDIHPATDNVQLTFNMSVDSGSNYNVTKTTTFFRAFHRENGSDGTLTYDANRDLAQSTDFQPIASYLGNDNDQCSGGFLRLFNPSSTTFVKHFIATTSDYNYVDYAQNCFIAGYGNTTSSVNAIQFKMSSGNIDAGDILLYGVN